MILVVLPREPAPDAEVWSGRRTLAVFDALGWPAAWATYVVKAPLPTGAIGQFVLALCIVSAVLRLHRAVACNHRYFFTTWKWGKRLAGVFVVGCTLKLAIWFSA